MKFNRFTGNKAFHNPYRTQAPNNAPDNTNIGKNTNLPLQPHSVSVINPFVTGVLDIRWSDAAALRDNCNFNLLGYNVYRSFDSEIGPYELVNSEPIEILQYRDITINKLVVDEDVSGKLVRGSTGDFGEWYFTTENTPIVKNISDKLVYANQTTDVVVKIDNRDGKGLLQVPVRQVLGFQGKVFLINSNTFDPVLQKTFKPRLPESDLDKITCSYHYNLVNLNGRFDQRIFYKITSVGKDKTGATVETDLRNIKAATHHQMEATSWIWREAIRRNRWILEQGGERVSVLIRKQTGVICTHGASLHDNRAKNDCPTCYGTGFVGGYYGSENNSIIIAPPQEEKDVKLTELGIHVSFIQQTWTGPTPMLSERDIVVKSSGERFFVGAISRVGGSGAFYQQHFQIALIDKNDIIYKVPILGGAIENPGEIIAIDAQASIPEKDTTRDCQKDLTVESPIIPSNKTEYTPKEKTDQDTGRSVNYENITF